MKKIRFLLYRNQNLTSFQYSFHDYSSRETQKLPVDIATTVSNCTSRQELTQGQYVTLKRRHDIILPSTDIIILDRGTSCDML